MPWYPCVRRRWLTTREAVTPTFTDLVYETCSGKADEREDRGGKSSFRPPSPPRPHEQLLSNLAWRPIQPRQTAMVCMVCHVILGSLTWDYLGFVPQLGAYSNILPQTTRKQINKATSVHIQFVGWLLFWTEGGKAHVKLTRTRVRTMLHIHPNRNGEPLRTRLYPTLPDTCTGRLPGLPPQPNHGSAPICAGRDWS